jgi:hypothetical protein
MGSDMTALWHQHSSTGVKRHMLCCAGASEAVVLKPAAGGGPAGVAALASHTDLGWYARALAERRPFVPAGMLSQTRAAVLLPLEPPPRFVAEPLVDSSSRCATVLSTACVPR